ncbi:MAG: hypothetical protein H5U40_14045, partial [Polyangiaceae bacterium]|nr:hypothetical protein [Polyangiaceae bacterium]
MTEGSLELSIKAGLTAVSFLAIYQRREKKQWPAKKAGPTLLILALLSAAAYYNIGIQGERKGDFWGQLGQRAFHGAGYVHHWETFHYVLGSKYFPELGYDGLYLA